MSDSVRLAKRVAELARCSRSEAEQYIEGGWVTVDGHVVEQPQHMVAGERVELDPGARLEAAEPTRQEANSYAVFCLKKKNKK